MYSNNPRRKHKSETTPPSQKTNGKPGNGRFGGPVHFKSSSSGENCTVKANRWVTETENDELNKTLGKLSHAKKVSHNKFSACCPNCHSSPGKFAIALKDETVLMHCNKGYCSQEKVLEALRALGINIGRLLHPNGKDKKKGKARKKPTITMPRFCMTAGNPEYAKLANKYFKTLKAKKRKELADSLRVSVASLIMLGVGWKEDDQCYTFPEHNERGEVCGIMRRWENGEQRMFVGHKRGVYFTEGRSNRSGPLLLVEGATKAAACWDAGFAVIGRPAAATGNDLIAHILKDFPGEIIVVGDNDEKQDGRWPGKEGAIKLAVKLTEARGQATKFALPLEGTKNVRDLKRPRRPALLEMIADAQPVEMPIGVPSAQSLPLESQLAESYLNHLREVLNAHAD